MRKIVGSGSWKRRISLSCCAEARSVPNGFSIATASAAPSGVVASAGSTLVSRRGGSARYDERVRMAVADHAADVLRLG